LGAKKVLVLAGYFKLQHILLQLFKQQEHLIALHGGQRKRDAL